MQKMSFEGSHEGFSLLESDSTLLLSCSISTIGNIREAPCVLCSAIIVLINVNQQQLESKVVSDALKMGFVKL